MFSVILLSFFLSNSTFMDSSSIILFELNSLLCAAGLYSPDNNMFMCEKVKSISDSTPNGGWKFSNLKSGYEKSFGRCWCNTS